jgi:hypothetical protein
MRGWTRVLLGGLLLCAIATAGIGLNFTLLRLTGDAHDPVGRLSPRAVFSGTTTATTKASTPHAQTDTPSGSDDESRQGDGDTDD